MGLKRTGFKPRTSKLQAKTRMKQVSSKKRAYRGSEEGKAAKEYLGLVKRVPCVICGSQGVNDAHHCQSGRYGTRKVSDFDTISLCPKHHRHEYGPGAYHYSKSAWEEAHGPDHEYISKTREMIGEMM